MNDTTSSGNGAEITSRDTFVQDPCHPRYRKLAAIVLAVGIAAMVVLLWWDAQLSTWLTSEDVRSWIERRTKIFADTGIYLLLLAILASYPNRWRLWAGFVTPVALATLLTHGLKWAIGRARPRLDVGAFTFQPFSGAPDFDSFPSGHSSAAMVIVLLLGLYFPGGRWVFYGLVLLVGIERMIHDWHFPSDVVAGYLIGGLAVFFAVRLLGPSCYTLRHPAAH